MTDANPSKLLVCADDHELRLFILFQDASSGQVSTFKAIMGGRSVRL